ncbi:MAG: toxin [Deltaproteobacteria bacterium]|nr:toxin [Deltaproteobacteria bacterium]
MKVFDWNDEKNAQLKAERGVSFEMVVLAISQGALLDALWHPKPERYGRQKIFVVELGGYAYLVPFVEDEDCVFLKTIIPSRKATREYVGRAGDEKKRER